MTKFSNLNRSEFGRSILVLVAGTSFGQALPIAASPILCRIYTPEDFGIAAIFMALVMIASSIASGRYEFAVMLPEDDDDAINVAFLSVTIATIFSCLLWLLIIFFNADICKFLNAETIGPWLHLVPATVLCASYLNILNYICTRRKRFADLARASAVKGSILVVTQLALGWTRSGAIGLIAGQIISLLIANLQLLASTRKSQIGLTKITLASTLSNATKYRDFPLFSMPATLANSLALNYSNMLISTFYSTSTLGFYSITQRLLTAPMSIIGTSIGQVFFQRASAEKRSTGRAVVSFRSTLIYLILIAAPVFALIYITGEELFAFILGEPWRIAGKYATILTPLFAIRFIVTSLSTINSVFEKQKISLLWQIGLLALTLGLLAYYGYNELAFESYLHAMTWITTSYYILLFWVLHRVSQGKL